MSKHETNNGKPGGILKGKTHKEGGIQAVVVDTKEPVELETDEVIITAPAVKDPAVRTLSGTNAEILSEINQSGGGVPIPTPGEFKYGGPIVQFNRNQVPNKSVMHLAARIKSDMPAIWANHGTSFENNLYEILAAVLKRGHWLPTEKDSYKIWQMYCFNNKSTDSVDGIVGMIKCGCTTKSGYAHMKKVVEQVNAGTSVEKKEHIKTFKKLKKNPDTSADQAAEMISADHVSKTDGYYTELSAANLETGGIVGTNSEYDKAVSDLHRAESLQKTMKSANAILRSKKDVTARLIKESGLSETLALKLQEPDRYGRVGFPSYQLTNNNASIKRLKDRVNMLEKKLKGAAAAEQTGQSEAYDFEGGSIEINYPIDRVQILFDSIPSAEVRSKLKGNGWNWSPSNKAWQRKITPQAISNSVYLFSAKKRTASAPEESTVPATPSGSSTDFAQMLENRNFSYVSGYIYKAVPGEYNGDTTFNLVYFDLIKPTVIDAVREYFKLNFPAIDTEKISVNVYPKTYVKEARKLFEQGRYLPSDVTPEKLLGSMAQSLTDYFSARNPEKNQITELKAEFEKSIQDFGITQAYLIDGELNLVSDFDVPVDLAASMERYLKGEPIQEPITAPAPKYLVVTTPTKVAKGSIGSVIAKPNPFVTEMYFGEDKSGNRLTATIDNTYLTPVSGAVKTVITGKATKFELIPSEEVLLPNTPEEFDEVIFSNIEPFEGWETDEVKQRDIKTQIYNQIQGPETDRISETERLFKKYVDKFTPAPAAVIETPAPVEESPIEFFQGIGYEYPNQYALNKAIEQFITSKTSIYTSDEKVFIRKYSGYGGLDKYGKTGKGGLFEYYTPKEIIEKMWALAYKYGYNDGPILEPAIATGEFLQYAPQNVRVVGYEINTYSAQICRILYPESEVILQPFEQVFIKNNFTIKDKTNDLEKFDLVIGNPPYGDFSVVESRYMSGMGEKDHTKARNYVEYFLRRGLDLLNPGGLLIYIIGAQLKNGGTMFLDGGDTPVKKYLFETSELVDAYRLPDSVFERTSVTADIIVLQKK